MASVAMLMWSVVPGLLLGQLFLHPTWGILSIAMIAIVIRQWLTTPTYMAIVSGTSFGVSFMLSLFNWAYYDTGASQIAFAIIAALIESVSFAMIAVLTSMSLRFGPFFGSIAIAVVWCLAEYLRSVGDWGMPYGEIGVTLSRTVLASATSIFGVPGLTFVVVLAASCIAYASLPPTGCRDVKRQASLLFAGCVLCIPAVTCLQVVKPHGSFNVLVCQMQRAEETTLATLFDISRRQADHLRRSSPAMLLFPETLVPQISAQDALAMRTFARNYKMAVVIGSFGTSSKKRMFNSAVAFSPFESPVRYDKRQLVPFGEYAPLQPLIMSQGAELSRGRYPMVLRSQRSVLLGVLICYEAAFARYVGELASQHVDAIAVLINNDWFTDRSGLELQYEAISMRAREYGRSFVVSSTEGPSGVISWTGRRALYNERARLVAIPVDLPTNTFFGSYGIVAIVILTLLTATVGLLVRLRARMSDV